MRDKSMQKPEQRKNGPIGDWIYIRYLGAMTEFEKRRRPIMPIDAK